ncbi:MULTISPECIES: LCP family protein [Nocardia]|uniref:LCP family protein n=1 Tax=Nocardia TaxID=1817 RepID=UPI000D68D0D9|nr:MULTISPECIES: LCP family protein [Nocardia]
MNGDDPQFKDRRRGVPPPPPARGGDPAQRPQPPRQRPPQQPHRPPPPQQGRGPVPSHIEPTKRLHRDAVEQPLAYSQPPAEPIIRRTAPPPRPNRRTHAPTQRPEPFNEPAPRGRNAPPPQRPQSRRNDQPPPSGPPPSAHGRAPQPPRRRRKRHPFRWFLVFLLVLVLAAIGGIFHLDGKLVRIDALAGYTDRVGDTPGTNWLLVGSDGRGGLSSEQEQELATGGEVGPERTDTIMLVHIPKSGDTTLISLPRDSYVSIPGHGKDKLNAAFAFGGPQLLVQTVEIATGLRVDHYAQIGFAGFAGIVDSLGGIDVCVPMAIDDPLAGIDLQPGCQKLDGPTALGFVRSRATALADIDRMNNQRLFMAALLKKATSGATLANPFKLWPLATDTVGSLKVDEGDHLWDLGKLGWSLRGDTVATTVPIGGFEDTDSGNVVVWDKSKASQFFDALATDQPVPEALLTR